MLLPAAAAELLGRFREAFTRPSHERFVLLFVGFIITPWRRTVSRVLWTVRWLQAGNASSYHRFFSRAKWSCWQLGHVLAAAVLECVPAHEPVLLGVDDTVTQHRGKKVWGKGCHRDAVRSSWKTLTRKWGHKWVSLCVLVKFPFASRPWALPVICCLYRTPQDRKQKPRQRRLGKTRRTGRRDRKHKGGKGERHKVAAEMARSMVAAMLHWFPRRRFILLGDGGFSTHDLACFACRHGDRLTLIGRMRKDTSLFALPATLCKGAKGGRPAKKGIKLPGPESTVQKARENHAARKVKIKWYGNRTRELELVSACGAWYRPRGNGRSGLVPLRWVFSCDQIGKREDYFYSTDPAMTAEQIVELFACRWNVEVTFQEARAHLGLETTRQRKKESVLRTAPLMLGAFSCVSLIYARMRQEARQSLHHTPCYHKSEPTFADALYALRRELWQGTVMQHLPQGRCFNTLPHRLRSCLLEHLAEAA